MSTPLQCLQCQSTIFYVGHCYRCKSQQKMQYWMEQSDQDIAQQLEHLLPLLNSPNSEEKKQAVQTAVEIWCYRGQARPDVSEKIWVLAEQKEYKDTHDYLFLCTAPYSVAEQALHRLSTETLTRRQIVDLLSILAQINWELKYHNITQFFQQSVAQPYTWQEDIPLLLLTHSSGWSFSQSAAKLLTHPPYSLVATPTQKSKTYSHQLGVRQKETCSFCKVPLFDLLVLDSGEPALHFLG